MWLSVWLDVAIGLAVIYLGTSLFVTVLNEFVAQAFNLRGRHLVASLAHIIDDPKLRQQLGSIPVIAALFPPKAVAPSATAAPAAVPPAPVASQPEVGRAKSYVDATFLAGLLVHFVSEKDRFSVAVKGLTEGPLKAQLQAVAAACDDTVNAQVVAVSEWLNRSMSMLGEGYKRNLQLISLGLGLALAAALNLDTVALVDTLYRDKQARDAAVLVGEQTMATTQRDALDRCATLGKEERAKDAECVPLDNLVDAVRSRNGALSALPIGWKKAEPTAPPSGPGEWPLRLLGWLLTGLAVSLGAPFWFDLLNRFVNVRHAMRKPAAAASKDSKDSNDEG